MTIFFKIKLLIHKDFFKLCPVHYIQLLQLQQPKKKNILRRAECQFTYASVDEGRSKKRMKL